MEREVVPFTVYTGGDMVPAEELHSALRHLTQLLIDKRNPNDVAWWLCANHPRFVMEHQTRERELCAMASVAGTPPKGKDWPQWFDRVRKMERTI